MALHSEMRRLTQTLLADYTARMEAVADLRSNVQLGLGVFRVEQQAVTAEQQKKLDGYVSDLRQKVADLRQSAESFVEDLGRTNRLNADEQNQRLAKERQSLAVDTAYFRGDVNAALQEMAHEQEEHLVKERQTLAADTGSFLADEKDALQEMAHKQTLRLRADRRALAAQVAKERAALQADQREASREWSSLGNQKQHSHAGKSIPTKIAKLSHKAPAVKKVEPIQHAPVDDLAMTQDSGSEWTIKSE